MSKQATARILSLAAEHGAARTNRSTRLVSSWPYVPKSALPAPHLSIDVDDDRAKSDSSRPIIPAAMNFSDSSAAHGQKTNFELLRALVVFRVCQVKWIVENATTLLNVTSRLGLTEAIVGPTFYKHFCAGKDSVDMKPVVDMLQRNGIRPILDYAAENEGGGESDEGVSPEGVPRRRVIRHGMQPFLMTIAHKLT